MSKSKPVSDPNWVDPDDAPEWTDEMFDRAEFKIGDTVIRPAHPEPVEGPTGSTSLEQADHLSLSKGPPRHRRPFSSDRPELVEGPLPRLACPEPVEGAPAGNPE
jgi:hypothetical protein